jgi:alkanesulfonate monooxygenase SsuD/methylene tetrahydromethanopterin reductase-like flavin-dependent oxidoreductase (luciferase family)
MGTGGSEAALRRVVRTADGWMPLLLPGLDPIDFRTGVERLRQLAADADRDPATLPIHGRVYLGDGWQKQVDEALEVGVAHLSIGFNRMANRGLTHAQHLDAVLAVKPELDRLVGRS